MRFNEITQQLSEDFDPIKRQYLDDLISQYRDATDPTGYDDDAPDPDEVIAQIRQEFGDKIANDLEQGPSSHFPRDNHSMGYDSLKHSGSPRVTKSGKVNRQDVSALKGRLQQRAGSHTQPTLPEGVAEGFDKLTPQQKAHEYNLDSAQREMDRRHAQGEDMTGAKIDKKTYKIVKPKQQGVAEAEDTDEKKYFKVTYTNPKTEENKVVKIKAHDKDEVLDYCVSKGYKEVSITELASEGYRVVPGFDKEKYQERTGLEGPFHTKSGKVVYYDKKEGSYYDPDSDMYISYEDWNAMNEGWKDKLAAGALAATMALGAAGAHARVTPGQEQDPGINRLTGKPVATQVAPADQKPAAQAPTGFSKEYLQGVVDGKHPRPMISVEKAQQLLKQMGESVDEAAPGFIRTAAGLAAGGVAAAGVPALMAVLGPVLGIGVGAYGAYHANKFAMAGADKLWDMVVGKLGSDDSAEEFAMAHINASLKGQPTFNYNGKTFDVNATPQQAKVASAEVRKVAESSRGVAEAGFGRATGRASWDSNMPGYQGDYGGEANWGRREREDDEHHEIDRRQEQQAASGTWYITIDGKLLKNKEGQAYQFVGKAAATKAARAMMAEPLHQGKKFMLTAKGA